MSGRRGVTRCDERGMVLPLTAVALVAVAAAAALSVDLGHAYLSKSELQSALDAAALSGAKSLDQSADTAQAEAEARAVFVRNAAEPANRRLAEQLAGGDLVIGVQFSSTLTPFTPGSTPARYVRVRGTTMQLSSWFGRVIGIDTLPVSGSAVAGPSPTLEQVCNVVPIMVCGDTSGTAGGFFGYTQGTITTLKFAAGDNSDVGPGNFRLIRLDGLTGANDLRDALAGNFERCMSVSNNIETEPGNKVGPVVQGLNTRLGLGSGATGDIYRPDLVSSHPGLRYDDYVDRYAAEQWDHPDGEAERRILVVPFGDCSQVTTGHGFLPLLGFGCFFMLDAVTQRGNEADVTGEFISECNARGTPGPTPGSGPGPHLIQLYKDPDNVDA